MSGATELLFDTPMVVLRSITHDPALWGAMLAGIALGAMVFFSVVMAPLVFTQLDARTAGHFIRRVFPWYYAFGGIVAGGAAVLLTSHAPIAAALTYVSAGLSIASRQVLMPAINRAKDRADSGEPTMLQRFNRLHRASVIANAVQCLVIATAFSLAFYRI